MTDSPHHALGSYVTRTQSSSSIVFGSTSYISAHARSSLDLLECYFNQTLNRSIRVISLAGKAPANQNSAFLSYDISAKKRLFAWERGKNESCGGNYSWLVREDMCVCVSMNLLWEQLRLKIRQLCELIPFRVSDPSTRAYLGITI